MSYIGKIPATGNFVKLDSISVVNGQASYTMQSNSVNFTPESVNHMLVSLNGVIQAPQTSFTISGSTITFASALSTGDVINFIMVYGNVLDIGTPSDDTISASKLQTDSVQTAKIVDDAVTKAKVNFISDATAGVEVKGDGGSNDGYIALNCRSNSHAIKLKSPPHSAGQSYTLTFPSTAPATDKFLKTDNSGNLSFADAGGGAWTFIKSQTASGASSVEFKNGVSDVVLDSTYCMYKLIGYDITVTADDSNLEIFLSTDAGSSYATSGYDTITQRLRQDAFNSNGASTTNAINLNSIGNSTNEEAAFEWNIWNPSSSSTYAKYWFHGSTRDHLQRVGHHDGGGQYEATSDIDAIKIAQSSGNISGTFKLYGLKGA